MPVRVLIALVLLCSAAQAADPWVPFRKAFPGKPPPVVVEPLPPVQETAPEAIDRALLEAELQAAVKRAEEAAERAEKAEAERAAALRDAKSPVPPLPQPKPKVRQKQRQLPILPGDPDYISCSDARRGVTMSCFSLRLNAHVYEGYSEKKKAMAADCLTAAEQARIKACFN